VQAYRGFRAGCQALHGEFQLHLLLACGATSKCQLLLEPYPGDLPERIPRPAEQEQPSLSLTVIAAGVSRQDTAPEHVFIL